MIVRCSRSLSSSQGARGLAPSKLNSVLPALGVSSVWVLAINGILLILAIAVDRVVALRVASALKKRNARHA